MKQSIIKIFLFSKIALKVILSCYVRIIYISIIGSIMGSIAYISNAVAAWIFGLNALPISLLFVVMAGGGIAGLCIFFYISAVSLQAISKARSLSIKEISSQSLSNLRKLIDEGFVLSENERRRRRK